MRSSAVLLYRYFEVSRAANDRSLDAFGAAVENRDAICRLDRHCRPTGHMSEPGDVSMVAGASSTRRSVHA